ARGRDPRSVEPGAPAADRRAAAEHAHPLPGPAGVAGASHAPNYAFASYAVIRSKRIGLAHTVLAVFPAPIVFKAADVQLVQGTRWRARAARQQTAEQVVPAPRGDILDATHRVLAQSRETVRLEISPREVREPRKLKAALSKLHVDPALIA